MVILFGILLFGIVFICLLGASEESLGWLAVISLVALIVGIIMIIYVAHIPRGVIWKEESKTNIIALKDNSNISGQITGGIFITSGYVLEDMYYYYMEVTEDGKHMNKIPADSAYIIETNDIKPSIIEKKKYNADKRLDFWFDVRTAVKYLIYVPKGTVDVEYKVNME